MFIRCIDNLNHTIKIKQGGEFDEKKKKKEKKIF